MHPALPHGYPSNLALDTCPITAFLVVVEQAVKVVQVLFKGYSLFNVVRWFGREY